MNPITSLITALLCATLLSPSGAAPAAELTRVFYPDQDNAEFTVDVPSDWKLIPQGEEGAEEYFEVEGPNGLELSFRTVPGNDIDAAIEAHIAYLKENFSDMNLSKAKETTINGMDAILCPGHGTDEDGSAREFGAGWFQISDSVIGELWYNVADDDTEGTQAAIAVLNSLSQAE